MTMIILDIIRFVLELCMLNSIFFTSDGLECAMGKGMLALHRMELWARFASQSLVARFASHGLWLASHRGFEGSLRIAWVCWLLRSASSKMLRISSLTAIAVYQ